MKFRLLKLPRRTILSFLTVSCVLCAGAIFLTPAPSFGQDDSAADFSTLAMTGEGQVEAVIDPLRLQLLDGRIIQLAGIDYPDLTPHDIGDTGLAALTLLRDALLKKTVKIYQNRNANNKRVNRMGYHVAHIVEKNSGVWIQGALLEAGMARVLPSPVHTEMAAAMIALEDRARLAKAGLWNPETHAGTFDILSPGAAGAALHRWAIVQGTVRASAMAGNNIYLNFGPDWRSDFTIGLPPKIRKALAQAGQDPLQFGGKTVRVRGWVEEYNGPYIELMDPVWLEVAADALPSGAQESSLPEDKD